jgi:hypothetical protein
MSSSDIAGIRLLRHHIAASAFKSPKDLVGWMGAMQAQDFAMVKWAVGVRLPGSTDVSIGAAINRGEILRTHLMRPTWHLVSADDIRWMLDLTAPGLKRSLESRHRELGLSSPIVLKTLAVIEKALANGRHATRDALIARLRAASIPVDGNRASHLLLTAELEGLVCSGASIGGKPSYALLEDRAPKTRPHSREESLSVLAARYFHSHGPALFEDFTWWSGLSARDARLAFEGAKPGFVSRIANSRTYWTAGSCPDSEIGGDEIHLLPAYDEFIISYKDRSIPLPSGDGEKAVSNNGVFKPVIVSRGRVAGIWRRTVRGDRVLLDLEFFRRPGKSDLRRIEAAAARYAEFLGKTAEIRGIG